MMPTTRATLLASAAVSWMREVSNITDTTLDTNGGAQMR